MDRTEKDRKLDSLLIGEMLPELIKLRDRVDKLENEMNQLKQLDGLQELNENCGKILSLISETEDDFIYLDEDGKEVDANSKEIQN